MADTKISAMTDGGAALDTDIIPAVRAGANIRLTRAAVATVSGAGVSADAGNALTLGTDTKPMLTAPNQAAAEAGTDTTPGAWSVLRVWQAIKKALGGVSVSNTPTTGQVLTATSTSAAAWAAPPGGAHEAATWAELLAMTGVPDGRVYTVLAPVVTGGTFGTQWVRDSTSPSGWRPRGRQVLHITTDVLDGAVDTSEQILYAPEVAAGVLSGCRVVDLYGRFGYSGTDAAARSARARINSSAAVSGAVVLHAIGGGVPANARFSQIAVTLYPISTTSVRLTAPSASVAQSSPRSVLTNTTTLAADLTVPDLAAPVYPMLTIQSGASPTTFVTRTVASLTVE